MKDFPKYRSYVFAGILVTILVFVSGFYYGEHTQSDSDKLISIINKDNGAPAEVDFSSFWKAWNVINDKYVPTNSTSTDRVPDQTRVYGAIEGMVKSLGDPYTIFFPPVESKSFNEEIQGNFGGVGMEVASKDGVLTVVSPLKGTPAYNAGIKTGDKILKINDTLTNTLDTDGAIKMIRGDIGTSVRLTIVRAGIKDPFEVTVVRAVINLQL